MTARSTVPIVLGVDMGTLDGRALRWAAEQAHLEGRRLELVTASGPVSEAQVEYRMGTLPVSPMTLDLRGWTALDRA